MAYANPTAQRSHADGGALVALALVAASLMTMVHCGPDTRDHRAVAPLEIAKTSGSPAASPLAPSTASPGGEPKADAPETSPPVLEKAPPRGDVATFLRHATEKARAAGEQLVVYVGAPWCQPCKRFKKALKAGKLDNRGLGGLRFIEFDHDRDVRRLTTAGYRSRYIPLFAIAGSDGRASGRKFTGGSKGPGAVDTIVTRLSALLTPTQ